MKNNIQLSIIIINYNTHDLTCKCLNSVYDNMSGTEFEVVLVDNASTETNPIVFKENFPQIKLVENKENVGFAAGNNIGIQNAQGEYILLLNSDAFLKDDSTLIGINFLKENENLGVVTGKLIYPDGKLQHNCQSFPSVFKKYLEKFRLHKFLSTKQQSTILSGFYGDYSKTMYPDWVWGTYFLFQKSNLNLLKNEQLADDFFMYMEDMQWCLEFKKAGLKCVYLPRIEVIHEMGGSKGSKNTMISENFNRFLRMYYSKIEYFLLKK